MSTLCGADCSYCSFSENCRGCGETCGSPFGGRCVAAEYIKAGGEDKYFEFKDTLKNEINALLRSLGLPEADNLNELPGFFVNLEYTLPNGKKADFIDEKNLYLGTQITIEGSERCIGVVSGTEFILICSYGENGSDPELVLYKKR